MSLMNKDNLAALIALLKTAKIEDADNGYYVKFPYSDEEIYVDDDEVAEHQLEFLQYKLTD